MEKKQFKAESARLLDLMINSIYTNKEIFLRELISNASDAIDKLAYTALTDDKVGLSREDFAITITRAPDAGILTISDNGIGMNKMEMEENLGTIAKSGSLSFKQAMEKSEDIDIIGQFGVGFYSAFMVASSVTVISKKYGEDTAWKWISDGADGYSIEEAEREFPGTDVILTMKQDTEDETYSDFLQERKIRSLVKKYSDYIRHPIKMEVTKSRKKEDSDEHESYTETETLNSMVPIWQRAKKDVTEEEYAAFYREKFFDYNKPARIIHQSAEGTVSFKALLFVPSKAPVDFYSREFKRGLQLYSSGVLIMESCEELLPEHFQFFGGIEKIACPGAHKTAHRDIRFFTDLPQQCFVRGQTAHCQSAAKFDPVGTAPDGCPDGGQAVCANFQYFSHCRISFIGFFRRSARLPSVYPPDSEASAGRRGHPARADPGRSDRLPIWADCPERCGGPTGGRLRRTPSVLPQNRRR